MTTIHEVNAVKKLIGNVKKKVMNSI